MQKNELLEQSNGRLERLSMLDELTGIANRRYFQRALFEDGERARESEQPLALILLDLDRFKDLNDACGHPAGDACLRGVGSFLAQQMRRSPGTAGVDVVARYGGEEFALLISNATVERAMEIAEAMRAGIERLAVRFSRHTALRITASCGVASMTPLPGEPMSAIIDVADRALYAAKHGGRNCVRYAGTGALAAEFWIRKAPH